MTRGKTVAETFGLSAYKPTEYKLDQLWLEIPLRADAISLFHMYPNSAMGLSDGTVRPEGAMSMSGALPCQDCAMPFKALLWLGDEERGLGFYASATRTGSRPTPSERSS